MVLIFIYLMILEDYETRSLKGILYHPLHFIQVQTVFHLQNEITYRTNTYLKKTPLSHFKINKQHSALRCWGNRVCSFTTVVNENISWHPKQLFLWPRWTHWILESSETSECFSHSPAGPVLPNAPDSQPQADVEVWACREGALSGSSRGVHLTSYKVYSLLVYTPMKPSPQCRYWIWPPLSRGYFDCYSNKEMLLTWPGYAKYPDTCSLAESCLTQKTNSTSTEKHWARPFHQTNVKTAQMRKLRQDSCKYLQFSFSSIYLEHICYLNNTVFTEINSWLNPMFHIILTFKSYICFKMI